MSVHQRRHAQKVLELTVKRLSFQMLVQLTSLSSRRDAAEISSIAMGSVYF